MPTITIIASKCNQANGDLPPAQDKFNGFHVPYLSLVTPALRKQGFDVEICAWNDPSVKWEEKEFILMGPTWDYADDVNGFECFLKKLAELEIPIMNHPKTMLWNLDKSYLANLIEKGIPMPTTRVIKNEDQLRALLDADSFPFKGDFIAIKGVKDTGGVTFKKIDSTNKEALNVLTQDLIKKNTGAIIQDFIPEIAHRGELSFVYFDDYCYMYFRIGEGDEERVQFLYGGKSFHFTLDSFNSVKPHILQHKPSFDVTVDMIAQCQQTANAAHATLDQTLRDQGLEPPRCVRVDGVITSTGNFLLMEAEMIEPNWEFEAAGVANFARAASPLQAFVHTVEEQYYSTCHRPSATLA